MLPLLSIQNPMKTTHTGSLLRKHWTFLSNLKINTNCFLLLCLHWRPHCSTMHIIPSLNRVLTRGQLCLPQRSCSRGGRVMKQDPTWGGGTAASAHFGDLSQGSASRRTRRSLKMPHGTYRSCRTTQFCDGSLLPTHRIKVGYLRFARLLVLRSCLLILNP